MPMRCPSCGASAAAGAGCPRCGTPSGGGAAETVVDPRHAPRTAAPGGASGGKLPWPAPPPPPRGRWRVWAGTYLPWALTGVVITIGAAAIAALWPSGRGGKVVGTQDSLR